MPYGVKFPTIELKFTYRNGYNQAKDNILDLSVITLKDDDEVIYMSEGKKLIPCNTKALEYKQDILHAFLALQMEVLDGEDNNITLVDIGLNDNLSKNVIAHAHQNTNVYTDVEY